MTTVQFETMSPTERRIGAEAAALERRWATDPRWRDVSRTYAAHDVVRLRGSVCEEYTLARRGAERLWGLLHERDYVPALGAITGQQAVQMVRAGLEAIYLSGWQVAADGNLSGQTYPDQSLYPANCFELMKAMIEAGAAGVHFEDQLASEKKCGHLGGKVLIPVSQFIRSLVAA